MMTLRVLNRYFLALLCVALIPVTGFSQVPDDAWTYGPTMPFGWYRFDAEYYPNDSFVYFLGGGTPDNGSNPEIWRFDPDSHTFQNTGATLPQSVRNYRADVLPDGSPDGPGIYIVAGNPLGGSGAFTGPTEIQVYYPSTNTALMMATDPLPVCVDGYIIGGQAVVGNKLYVFGGWDGDYVLYDDTWQYDPTAPSGQRWTVIEEAHLAIPRTYITPAVYGGKIYAIGGDTWDGTSLNAQTIVEVFDPYSPSAGWNDAAVADLPIPCDESQAFVTSDGFILAGCGQWPYQLSETMKYLASTDQWDTSFPDLNEARRNHAGGQVFESGLWVFGGRGADGDANPVTSSEFFPLSYTPPSYPNPPRAGIVAPPCDFGLSTISGTISSMTGAPVAGVTVSAGPGYAATTDGSGAYSISSVFSGTYTLTPVKPGWNFTPAMRSVTVPPDAPNRDFSGTPSCNLAQQPVLLVPGWGGSASDLSADENLSFFLDWLGPDYTEGCNVFYALGLTAEQSTRENAEKIQDALHAAHGERLALDSDWDGHLDIIGHSYGGINSREYLETELYESDQSYGGTGIHIDNLFTLGTPHGGGTPELPGAFLIGFGHIVDPDDWRSLAQLTPPAMALFNATHSQPSGTCYRLVGGHAFEQDDPWWLWLILDNLYGPLKELPNDLGVYRKSALELTYLPWRWKYQNVVASSTPDMHGYVDWFGFNQVRSYVHPEDTFDAVISSNLGAGINQCDSGLLQGSLAQPQPTPVPAMLVASGAALDGAVYTDQFVVDWNGPSAFYLNWPAGDLDLTLTDPNGTLIDAGRALIDPNVAYFELGALAELVTYVFTDTLAGTWGYTIYATTVPYTMPYRLVAVPSLAVAATAHASSWQPLGEQAILTATVTYDAATPILGATVQAHISRPDGGLDTLVLLDDGAHHDGQADDGVYGNSYGATGVGGYYGVSVQASGEYQAQAYTRTAETTFSVAPGTGSLTGTYSDQPRDDDGDGVFDWLDVEVGVTVAEESLYALAADLMTGTGIRIASASLQVQLAPGTHELTLPFDGSAIFQSGQDGPYILTHILLVDADKASLLLDRADDAYATAPYEHGQFGNGYQAYLPLILRNH